MGFYFVISSAILLSLFLLAKRKEKYKTALIVCNTIVCVIYMGWRLTAIPWGGGIASLLLGLLLFAAELLGLIAFFNFQYLFMGKYHLERKGLDVFSPNEVPFVDVLICTYNEPLYLLEMTIAAAVNMNYPKDRFCVYICDDGRRSELKELCKSYQIGYITRADNKGAKAGNINNALGVIQGELFAVLDADMIPTKDFLQRTVGYFSNPNLAFVQTPQVYYNQDMYQYNLSKKIPNEQDFFMRDIQEARAARNAVLHVGTNAVFRRQCVLNIGGYPTCSITEDMAVGMQLQAQGYDSLLVNEALVYGLSATTFSELVKQRDRWCRGNLQVLKNYNPLFTKGLSFSQKIAYLDGGIYWFANIQKMIFICCPLIYLFTGIPILNCVMKSLLCIYIPYMLGQLLMFRVLTPQTRSMRWAHYYETVMAPYLSLSVLKEMLNLKINFNVTSKETLCEKTMFQINMVVPHLVILAVSIGAWIFSLSQVIKGNLSFMAVAVNIGWSVYNVSGIAIALRAALQKPIFRKTERIQILESPPIRVRCQGKYISAAMRDISGQGCLLSLDRNWHIRRGKRLHILLEGVKIPCTVVRSSKGEAAMKFDNLSPEQMKAVMELFVHNIRAYYQVERNLSLQTEDVRYADERKMYRLYHLLEQRGAYNGNG